MQGREIHVGWGKDQQPDANRGVAYNAKTRPALSVTTGVHLEGPSLAPQSGHRDKYSETPKPPTL